MLGERERERERERVIAQHIMQVHVENRKIRNFCSKKVCVLTYKRLAVLEPCVAVQGTLPCTPDGPIQ